MAPSTAANCPGTTAVRPAHRLSLAAVVLLMISAILPSAGAQKATSGAWSLSSKDNAINRRAEPRRLHAGHHHSTASGCTIMFQGGNLTFQTCHEDPSGFIFHWNDLGDRVVQLAVTDQHVLRGWAGFGLGKQMVGSSVVAAFPTAGGIYSNKYFLAGKDERLVTPGEGALQLGADGILAEYSDGFLTMLFNLTLSEEQYPESDVIFARGPPGDGTTGRIPQHSNYYKAKIDWAEGGAPEEEEDSFTQAHGFLMVLVWAVLFPAGIISARFFRHLDPLWWNLHRGFQGVGAFFFVIAWLLGWMSEGKREPGMLAHLAFAFLLPIMVIMQVLAAVFHPKKDAENRPKWNLYHHWVGRSAVVLAIINIYVGLYIYEAESSAMAAFTIVWVLVLLVFVGLEAYWRLRGPWSVGYSSPTEIDMQSLAGKQREGFLKL